MKIRQLLAELRRSVNWPLVKDETREDLSDHSMELLIGAQIHQLSMRLNDDLLQAGSPEPESTVNKGRSSPQSSIVTPEAMTKNFAENANTNIKGGGNANVKGGWGGAGVQKGTKTWKRASSMGGYVEATPPRKAVPTVRNPIHRVIKSEGGWVGPMAVCNGISTGGAQNFQKVLSEWGQPQSRASSDSPSDYSSVHTSRSSSPRPSAASFRRTTVFPILKKKYSLNTHRRVQWAKTLERWRDIEDSEGDQLWRAARKTGVFKGAEGGGGGKVYAEEGSATIELAAGEREKEIESDVCGGGAGDGEASGVRPATELEEEEEDVVALYTAARELSASSTQGRIVWRTPSWEERIEEELTLAINHPHLPNLYFSF